MDIILAALPALLFGALSALPLAFGLFAALRRLRAGSRTGYLCHLVGSVAAGAVALGLLWSSLFGDSLAKSSTAGLIFAIAPVYAAAVQAIFHRVAGLLLRHASATRTLSRLSRGALLVPSLLLAILGAGLVKTAFHDTDDGVARHSSDARTLHRLLEKTGQAQPDAFGIAMNLSDNPAAPADILTELASYEHPVIRAHVAHNPHTPSVVVAGLRYDCASFVRKAVLERLGPETRPQPAPAPTGKCALARWR